MRDRKWVGVGFSAATSLYKIGGSYFALDGNHRISVAHYHGVEWIDAVVTEFGTPSPVEPKRPRTIEEPKEGRGRRGRQTEAR